MNGGYHIGAAEHPALGGQFERFLADLANEHRYFGPSARCAPKPSRRLIASMSGASGFRLVAVADDDEPEPGENLTFGELFVAVLADVRGRGVGRALVETAIMRAKTLGHTSLVIRTTRRALATHRLGTGFGGTVFEAELGRIEIVLDLTPSTLST